MSEWNENIISAGQCSKSFKVSQNSIGRFPTKTLANILRRGEVKFANQLLYPKQLRPSSPNLSTYRRRRYHQILTADGKEDNIHPPNMWWEANVLPNCWIQMIPLNMQVLIYYEPLSILKENVSVYQLRYPTTMPDGVTEKSGHGKWDWQANQRVNVVSILGFLSF